MARRFPYLARMLQRLSYGANKAAYWVDGQSQNVQSPLLDEYVSGMPTAQNAIDALPGWCHALPGHVGALAGPGAFYEDPRILWAIEQFGPLAGRTVLELGPLEASHTYMLDRQAPDYVHAIEANKTAYLRCLVVKELLDITRAKFFLGDFVPWLRSHDVRYDLIVASGVLYHMQNPLELLELIAARSDAFYLWTHYFDEAAMPPDDLRRKPFLGEVKVEDFRGTKIRLHPRSYFSAWQSKAFCGGMHDLHYWIEKDDILAAIQRLGFDEIQVGHDEPGHQNGPSFSVFARRKWPDQ
jgi:hypothetical protein